MDRGSNACSLGNMCGKRRAGIHNIRCRTSPGSKTWATSPDPKVVKRGEVPNFAKTASDRSIERGTAIESGTLIEGDKMADDKGNTGEVAASLEISYLPICYHHPQVHAKPHRPKISKILAPYSRDFGPNSHRYFLTKTLIVGEGR